MSKFIRKNLDGECPDCECRMKMYQTKSDRNAEGRLSCEWGGICENGHQVCFQTTEGPNYLNPSICRELEAMGVKLK